MSAIGVKKTILGSFSGEMSNSGISEKDESWRGGGEKSHRMRLGKENHNQKGSLREKPRPEQDLRLKEQFRGDMSRKKEIVGKQAEGGNLGVGLSGKTITKRSSFSLVFSEFS